MWASRWALWFAFDLFFDDICYSFSINFYKAESVVICFRFVLWWYLLQLSLKSFPTPSSCDLLSICSLMIFVTAVVVNTMSGSSCDLLSICSLMIFVTAFIICPFGGNKLWFAFDLFFDDICYSEIKAHHRITLLWFAFDLFFDDICYSLLWASAIIRSSCDLLSICSLMIFVTAEG